MNLLPDPPTLLGLRYRTIFQMLQVINGVRYLICPDYLNHKQPIPTYISIFCILIPSAISFFLALDEKSRSWEIVQNFTYFIGFVYVTLVTSCLYSLTDSDEKKSENVWDQMLYWHELFITCGMHSCAKSECLYYEKLEQYEREIEEQEVGEMKSKKQRKAEERKEKDKISKNFSKINLPTKEIMDNDKGRYYQGLL
ncbi:hypothetical protein B9Z55_009116 [Caenorhabditis nigoni]|nr:hypothetical protein B9Z55_009116 [Caenorhabditis nigoni]